MSATTLTTTTVELDNIEPAHDSPGLQHDAKSIRTIPSHVLGPSIARTASHSAINEVEQRPTISKGRSYIIIAQLAGAQFLSSFSNGLTVIAIPTIAASLHLREDLLIWPTSVTNLTSGSCLLIAGSVADVIGPARVNLAGCLLVALTTLACGLSRNGSELIAFRALQGVAYAMTIPSSVSLVTSSVASGRPRNIGFACIGLSMPFGFSFGLVIGGVLTGTIGWRTGFYIDSAAAFVLFGVGLWALPSPTTRETTSIILKKLAKEIDWIGAVVASSALALLSYCLAMLASDVNNIKEASSIVPLVVSLILFVGFAVWMQRREAQGKSALIPNSLWNKSSFTCICIIVMLCNACTDSMELFCSLFYQQVQDVSALGASLRLLPSLVIGTAAQLTTGLFVHRVPVIYIVACATALGAVAPLLMAIIQPHWPYWYDAFFAQILSSIGADALFTVGLLIVSDSFPAQTQALAGAVFSTFIQVGVSTGLTVMSVVSSAVTRSADLPSKTSPNALMAGYRAAFWTAFG